MSGFSQRLAAQEAEASLEMAKRWKAVEDRLQGYFDALLDQVAENGVKTRSEVFRLYRYESLIRTAQDEIAQFEQAAGQMIGAQQARAIDLGFEAAVQSIYGERYFAPTVNRGALEALIGVCADGKPLFSLLEKRGLTEVSVTGLTDALIEGLALGYNPRKTARMMANGLAAGLEKALTIARTEQVRAYREATRAQYEAMGIKRYQRHCAKSDRTCVACLALDSKIYAVNRVMDSHPNCILPGNEVVAADLLGASKSFYDGRAIEILIANGRRITVTPNHPILTDKGWVSAKFIHEGMNVIVAADSERVAHGINPNYQYRPIKIENVFRSLEKSAFMAKVRVKFSPEDFHGDAEFFDGNIDVVLPKSFLLRNGKSMLGKPGSQFEFSRRNIREQSLLRCRTFNKALNRPFFSSYSGMSTGCKHLPFFVRQISHADNISFCPITNRDSVFKKPFSECGSGYACFFRKGKYAFSCDVSLDKGNSDNWTARRPGIFNNSASVFATESGLNEALRDNIPVYTDLLGQFIKRFSADIAAVQVVNVRNFNFRGHVYDLQTSKYSLFMVNSIIAHNCRCFMVAVIAGMEPERASAQEWFAGLDEKRQREILGKGRFELYQQGVPLEKMTRVKRDPVWGPTLGVKPLSALSAKFVAFMKTYPGVTVELGGNKRIEKVIENSLDELQKQGYDFPKTIKADAEFFAKHKVETSSPCAYMKNVLYINDRHRMWKDPAGYMQESHSQGVFSAEKPEGAIWHEVAHFLHQKADPVTYNTYIGGGFEDDAEKAIAALVSEYATESAVEFVAEMFAARLAGMDKNYPFEVYALFQKYGGGI